MDQELNMLSTCSICYEEWKRIVSDVRTSYEKSFN